MTPVGHTIVGIWLGDLTKKNISFKYILFYTLISSLPDFDIIVGLLLFGKKGVDYHQLYTHNFLFVFIITTLTYYLSKKDKKITLFVFLALLSHLFLDLIVIDKKPPIGISPFFPFYMKTYNIPLLLGVNKSSLKALFSLHNLKAVIIEIIVLTPLWSYVLYDYLKLKKGKK